MIHLDDIFVGQEVQILRGSAAGLNGIIVNFKFDDEGKLVDDQLDVKLKGGTKIMYLGRDDVRLANPDKSFDKRINYSYSPRSIKENQNNKINMKKLVFESLDQLFEAKKLADIKSTHAKVEKTKAKKENQSAVEKAEQAIKALEAQKKLAQKPGARKQTVAQKKADIEAIQKKIDAWKKKLEAAKQ